MTRVSLPSGVPAEIARGREGERGVVLNPDIGGLRPLFDDLCARLARDHGWTVCAVEPFPGREEMDLAARMDAMAGLDDTTQVSRLVEAADLTGCDPVAVMGFCMGGMYALKAAASGRFDRAVSFYGMIRVPEQWRGPGQRDALDVLTQVPPEQRVPVMSVIGGVDPWTPASQVDELEAWGATVLRFPDADHGFVHDPARPAHRPDDAAEAWRRAVAFLD